MAEGDLITGDYQIEWRGLVLGQSRLYGLKKLEGWIDLPSHRTGIEPRSGRHGSYAGQLLSEHRTVTADLLIRASVPDFAEAVRELRRVTASSESAPEEPLVIQWHGRKQMVMARCVRRMIPAEYNSYPQGLAPASVQWVASDPRQLELPSVLQQTGLAVAVGGLEFPLVFPLDFGLGTIEGSMVLTNSGNADAWPIFSITGPAPEPKIINTNTGKTLAFKNTTTILGGETWEIDTNHRTVTLLGTNISKNAELLIRGWFPIPPGESHTIQFVASAFDPAAQLSALVHNTDL